MRETLFAYKLSKMEIRLGSVSPARMNEFPKSVQRLLEQDMPRLLALAHAARCLHAAVTIDEAITARDLLTAAMRFIEVEAGEEADHAR